MIRLPGLTVLYPSAAIFGGGTVSASPTIAQLEVLGAGTTLDPVGAGPYDYGSNGTLIRIRYNWFAPTSPPLSDLNVSNITVNVNTDGYTSDSSTISATRRTISFKPLAVLRRMANGAGTDITNTTQVMRQSGSLTAAPTVGVAVDLYLVCATHIFASDTVSLSFAAGWNGGSSTAGVGPAVTNSSTMTSANIAQPIYGFMHTPCTLQTASTMPVELQVAFQRYGWLGGQNSSPQMVAGVSLWATDGTNNGPVSTTTRVVPSQVQTVGGIAEVFRVAALDLTGVSDTTGTSTLGSGLQYVDGYIYPWRGTVYQISVNGVTWPTPQPCTVHPFIKDVAGNFSKAIAPVRADGLLVTAVTTGIVTTYPGSQPTAALSYSTINIANAALAAWHNTASPSTGAARPGGSPITHNNPSGGRILLVNTTGAAEGFEMTGTYTPGATATCITDIEAYTGNANEAFYSSTVDRTWTGGFVRLKVRINRAGGRMRFGDTTSNSVASIFAMENANQSFNATQYTVPTFSNVAMVYLINVSIPAGNTTNTSSWAGLGQETASPYRCAKAIGVTVGDVTNSAAFELRPYHVVGLTGGRCTGSNMCPTTARQSTNDGFIVYNSKFFAVTPTVFDFKKTDGTAGDPWTFTRGCAIWQNVFECMSTSGNNLCFQGGTNGVGAPASVQNVGWGFNTNVHDVADNGTTISTDQRGFDSIVYRDADYTLGSTADAVIVGNIATRYAWKSGYFSMHNSSGAAGNEGNFTVCYGLDEMANVQNANFPLNNISTASEFAHRANDAYTVSNVGVMTWTNNLNVPVAAWASGIGWGDYSLKTQAGGGNNTGKGVIPAGYAWNKYGIAGVARKNAASGATNTTGAAGAWEATD